MSNFPYWSRPGNRVFLQWPESLHFLKRYSGILLKKKKNTRINNYYISKEYKKKKRFCFTELFIVTNFNVMRSSENLSGVRNSFLIPTIVYNSLHRNGIWWVTKSQKGKFYVVWDRMGKEVESLITSIQTLHVICI